MGGGARPGKLEAHCYTSRLCAFAEGGKLCSANFLSFALQDSFIHLPSDDITARNSFGTMTEQIQKCQVFLVNWVGGGAFISKMRCARAHSFLKTSFLSSNICKT